MTVHAHETIGYEGRLVSVEVDIRRGIPLGFPVSRHTQIPQGLPRPGAARQALRREGIRQTEYEATLAATSSLGFFREPKR